MRQLSRRTLLKAGLCTGAAAALPASVLAEWRRAVLRGDAPRPYLDAALRAERWIRSTAIDTVHGRTWPAVPGDAKRGVPEPDLYSGAPGVVLFYLELHAATGSRRFLEEAAVGAADIAHAIGAGETARGSAGLYEGLAGRTFAVWKVSQVAGDAKLSEAARAGVAAIATAARRAADGSVSWNDDYDIISGAAGTGLALLAMRSLRGDQATDLARRAGDHLLKVSRAAGDGRRKWMANATFPREMPNFSHGTAGVAYFLATLSQFGGESRHLDAARDGARYLQSIAVASGIGTVIRHHDGDGAGLFYLSWCHGPAGTARLWDRLDAIDHGGEWRKAEESGARGLVAQGVPERRTDGFWNNISQCCGNAGVAEYFLSRFERTRLPSDLAMARRMADDLLRRATVDGDAERWVQAENRVSPADVAAQTGWMQGAAGVGAMLLRLDAAVRGERYARAAVFPDAPAGVANG